MTRKYKRGVNRYKYLMEHFVREDMQSVVDDLADHGFPFQMSWLTPFFEFRFPFYGKIDVGTIRMELSMAIEPWNVLGEEMGSSGTSRFVDSSVDQCCNWRRCALGPRALPATAS